MWEDGKRIEWFEKAVAVKIERGEIDFRMYLKKEESFKSFEENNANYNNGTSDGYKISHSFYKPTNFDQRMMEVKENFGIQIE